MIASRLMEGKGGLVTIFDLWLNISIEKVQCSESWTMRVCHCSNVIHDGWIHGNESFFHV